MRMTDLWFLIALVGWVFWLGAVGRAIGWVDGDAQSAAPLWQVVPFLIFIVMMVHLVFRQGAFLKDPLRTVGCFLIAPLGAWIVLYWRMRQSGSPEA